MTTRPQRSVRQLRRNLADVNLTLHGMHGFAAAEHVLKFAAKRLVGEIVDQEGRTE